MKDADMLHGVQRKATKMSHSLRNFSYKERLKRLSMFSVRHMRLRGDMIKAFKMKVKPKWMNVEIKRLIKETRKAYQIQKTNSSEI